DVEGGTQPPSFFRRPADSDRTVPRRARPAQRLAQDVFLEAQLCRVVELLVGAAAAARHVGARARPPVRRSGEDRLRPSLDVAGTRRLPAHAQPVAREGPGHEHDLAFVTGETEAAIDALLDGDLDAVPRREASPAHERAPAESREPAPSTWKRLSRGR